jgi:hypothetical protein
MRIFTICTIVKHYSGDKIKKVEKSRACGTYAGKEKYIKAIGGKTWQKRQFRRPGHKWEQLQEIGWRAHMRLT